MLLPRFYSASFLVYLTIFSILLDSGFALMCWQCKGTATALCEADNAGDSVECPDPNAKEIPYGYDVTDDLDKDKFVCYIMRSEAISTRNIEVSKGCVLDDYYFLTKATGYKSFWLKPGECYTHDDVVAYNRFVRTHVVTICTCNDADNCNRDTIEGVGWENVRHGRRGKSDGSRTQAQQMSLLASGIVAMGMIFNHRIFRMSGGFTVCVYLAVILSFGLVESVNGLMCWECEGVASPQCERRNSGKSVECPDPNDTLPFGYDHVEDQDKFVCFIMKAESKVTKKIEVSKGCVLDDQYFITDVTGVDTQLLKLGTCYTHNDKISYNRYVDTHLVTICICNDKDNCNEGTIEGVGMEHLRKEDKSMGVRVAEKLRLGWDGLGLGVVVIKISFG